MLVLAVGPIWLLQTIQANLQVPCQNAMRANPGLHFSAQGHFFGDQPRGIPRTVWIAVGTESASPAPPTAQLPTVQAQHGGAPVILASSHAQSLDSGMQPAAVQAQIVGATQAGVEQPTGT